MKKIVAFLVLVVFLLSTASLALTLKPKRLKKPRPAPIEIKKVLEGPGPEPAGLPRFKPIPGKPQPARMGPKVIRKKAKKRIGPRMEFGLSAGLLAGIPGGFAEIRWHNPFEMVSTSLKYGVAYAQGEDANGVMRKHALLFLDAVYRMAPMWRRGFKPYIGAGFNYDVYTTDRKSGGLGGQAYLGLEGRIQPGSKLYLELGYGWIKADFFPTYRGMRATLGYRSGL